MGFIPLLGGCLSFATVRSADVHSGSSYFGQAAIASPPGDEAAWFWSFDCDAGCNHIIPGGEFGFTYGWKPTSIPAFSVGGGIAGLEPYAEGYVQFRRSPTLPFGIGGRMARGPAGGVRTNQLHARVDLPLRDGARLVWNPAVVRHTDEAANGETHGTFVGVIQGFALLPNGGTLLYPSISFVWSRAGHQTSGRHFGPERRFFAIAALVMDLDR